MNNYSSHLNRSYGLSQEAYDTQAAAQGFLCEICREANPHGKPLGVDHNHVTNANRGLLCDRCNKILGFARDNRHLLEMLRDYLLKHDGPGEPHVPNNPETNARRLAAFEQSLIAPEVLSHTDKDCLSANDKGVPEVVPSGGGVVEPQ